MRMFLHNGFSLMCLSITKCLKGGLLIKILCLLRIQIVFAHICKIIIHFTGLTFMVAFVSEVLNQSCWATAKENWNLYPTIKMICILCDAFVLFLTQQQIDLIFMNQFTFLYLILRSTIFNMINQRQLLKICRYNIILTFFRWTIVGRI